jgi:hypothetical protein
MLSSGHRMPTTDRLGLHFLYIHLHNNKIHCGSQFDGSYLGYQLPNRLLYSNQGVDCYLSNNTRNLVACASPACFTESKYYEGNMNSTTVWQAMCLSVVCSDVLLHRGCKILPNSLFSNERHLFLMTSFKSSYRAEPG